MMSTPNFYRLETSRWDLSNYNDFITAPLDNSDGRLKVPPKPGLGIEMNMDFLRRKRCGLIRRESSRNACSVKLSECGRVLAELDSHRLVGPQPPRRRYSKRSRAIRSRHHFKARIQATAATRVHQFLPPHHSGNPGDAHL